MGGTPQKKMKRTSEADMRLNVLLEIIEVLYIGSAYALRLPNLVPL